MEIFLYIIIFIYGALFGSFGSVIIHRLKSGEKGILGGRSHCNSCNTKLKYYDLVPILSWLSTFGKCRYCKSNISYVYPFLEIFNGLLFLAISIFLVDINNIILLDGVEIIKLIFWLIIGFITTLYMFYDILFLEIHEGIMLSGIGIAVLGLIANEWFINIIPYMNNFINDNFLIYNLSFIPLALIIIGLLYIIMLKELEIKYDIAILVLIISILSIYINTTGYSLNEFPLLSGIIGALGIFIFFFLQIVLSGGKALGGGDLRIGIMIGLLLGTSYSIAGLMITYIVGSIISIFIIINKYIKTKKSKIDTQVPFGPFLGIGFFITILFINYIDNFIEIYF